MGSLGRELFVSLLSGFFDDVKIERELLWWRQLCGREKVVQSDG